MISSYWAMNQSNISKELTISTCKTNMRKSLQNLASNVNQLGLEVHKEKDYKCDELDF
jgi:hypothetical protein